MSEIGEKPKARRALVIIGTSGSTDYLKGTDNRRYWPVVPNAVEADAPPLSAEDQAILKRLIEAGGIEPVAREENCDGLHDEGAPSHYLCSRCFPDLRGDLAEPYEDEEARPEPEEME